MVQGEAADSCFMAPHPMRQKLLARVEKRKEKHGSATSHRCKPCKQTSATVPLQVHQTVGPMECEANGWKLRVQKLKEDQTFGPSLCSPPAMRAGPRRGCLCLRLHGL